MCKALICSLLFLIIFPLAAQSKLTFLENDRIKLGILPQAGGRIVALHHGDSENLLLADESKWDDAPWPEITITPKRWGVYPNYFGHAIWLGPQKQWYNQQDIYDYMRDHTWPPDKHLNLTTYKILKQNQHSITLQGPASPISGMQLTKTYSIKDNIVTVQVRATNVGKKTYKWSLWSLTRVHGDADIWIHPGENGRYEFNPNHNGLKMSMLQHQGWLHTENTPLQTHEKRAGKYYTDCKTPVMAAFSKKHCLLIQFDKVPLKQLPPKHSNIEIFQAQSNDTKSLSFIELEHHNPYTTLQAGESMELVERWTVQKTTAATPQEQLSFLLQKLK